MDDSTKPVTACAACVAGRIHTNAEAQEHAKDCPSCIAKRVHSKYEWNKFHPDRGHGYVREQGWTKPPAPEAIKL
jgi:hypothetical protein